MANTYTQLYIQFVFAVRNRSAMIDPAWEVRLFKCITGIVQNHKHKMIAINGMPDHVHVFLGINPEQSLSTAMQIVKGESSEWINKMRLTSSKFQWQQGYGAFSFSQSHIDSVYNYILNQKQYHENCTFLDEYRAILDDFEVSYDDHFIFDEINSS